ncbi:hypothetical protein GL263_00785 [Streptomyces durbertensis]|uniref:Uncharacterized protein n=1 Tax=Streptomyces durbertensis TaxID=2448886 RepID=A0ABR6E9V6_9ACTN|nr:hypothetical protein [Streptomyces durbertensis]MBB1242120.1 hypothetical protein [Streptomyces durbertensis]
MTSRTPRDTRLSLVPRQAVATARRSAEIRRSRPAPRPPATLAPREELARQARAALEDAVRLARWAAAAGISAPTVSARAAEELGMPADRVPVHWDRAKLAGLVELHAGTARAGWRLRAWDRDDAAVLRGWVALFDAWSLAHPAADEADPTLIGDTVVAVPQFLSVMHLSSGPMAEEALRELLAQRVAELRTERACPGEPAAGPDTATPPPGAALAVDALPSAGELTPMLDWALDGLAAVGALTRCQTPDATGQAALTPLGDWAVWLRLERICVAALSPAGNIEQSAGAMLRGCARLSPGPARDEYRAWLAARPTGPAVAELLDAARGEDALVRALAFEALRVVGAPAEGAVRDAAEGDPVLRPYALLWLAEHEGADPEDLAGGAPGVLTRAEATWLWIDTAAAVADHGEAQLLVEHLSSAPQESLPRLLEEVRATGHPRTVQVLVALAAAHPDPALARAVRRAAFQVHTGG